VRRNNVVVAVVIAVVVLGVIAVLLLRNNGGDNSALTGKTWYLVSGSQTNPTWQWVVPPAQQADFTIEFNADKTFSAKADCNQLSGSWSTSGSDGLTIVPGPMTMALCGDQGLDFIYAGMLARTTNYATTGTGLDLTLTDGKASYTSVTPTATAEPSASSAPSIAPSAAPSPSSAPSPSEAPSPSAAPSPSPTPAPATATPAPSASAAPTLEPTPAPTASPSAAPSPTPPPTSGLTANPWQASAVTITEPPFQGSIPAEKQASYTITFGSDGTFSAQADCNKVAGTYTAASGTSGALTLTIGPSTLVACPPGSYSELYIAALTRVQSFAIATGSLTVTLSDGGTIGYVPLAANGASPSP
jgi:heat shock protein HslJ